MAGRELILTGKALEDFRVWFRKEIPLNDFRVRGFIMGTDDFFNLPDGMQWGMYEEFFEVKELSLDVYQADHGPCAGSFVVFVNEEEFSPFTGFDTRQEARCIAIENACEIYNSQPITDNPQLPTEY